MPELNRDAAGQASNSGRVTAGHPATACLVSSALGVNIVTHSCWSSCWTEGRAAGSLARQRRRKSTDSAESSAGNTTSTAGVAGRWAVAQEMKEHPCALGGRGLGAKPLVWRQTHEMRVPAAFPRCPWPGMAVDPEASRTRARPATRHPPGGDMQERGR